MNPSIEQFRTLFNDLNITVFFNVVLIVCIAWVAIWAAQNYLPRLAEHLRPRFRLPVLNSIPMIRLLLTVLAVLFIVPLIFNVTARTLTLLLYGLGVVVGFAAKDWVSSLLAGVIAIVERPYRSGDWVRFGDNYGEVISINTRTVCLRTEDDDVITVPHAAIWTEQIANANDGDDTLMCVAEFPIDPNQASERVQEVLKEVAMTSAWFDYDHPVQVVMQSSPHATVVRLKAYPFEMRDQFQFITDMLIRGREALHDIGVKVVSVPVMAAKGAK